ncbi:MAG: periplasmic heavy metal sensor [Chloracidobacterium sp.]|nr:periplasmic heavy metal sensor [Chloracidobacterium sp.]
MLLTKMLNPKRFVRVGLALAGMAVFSAAAIGQERRPMEPRPADSRFAGEPQEPAPRPNLLRELGLSPDQIEALRKLNQERKPVEEAARKRFQDATRGLNLAIYSDEVDEPAYRASLLEYQSAQAELARIKFSNELAVRRLLTPEQLMKFREIRRRFAEARERLQDRPARQAQPRGQFPPRRQPPPPIDR